MYILLTSIFKKNEDDLKWSVTVDVKNDANCSFSFVTYIYTIIPSNLYKLSLILKDIEEGHLVIENFVNIFFIFCNIFIGIVAQSSRLLYIYL